MSAVAAVSEEWASPAVSPVERTAEAVRAGGRPECTCPHDCERDHDNE